LALRAVLAGSALIAGLPASPVAPLAAARASDRPDFSGTWLLNKSRSDVVDDRDRGNPQTGRLGSSPGVGGSGPMGGAGVSGPLMGGRGADPALRERMRALARIAFGSPQELVISNREEIVRIVDDEGHVTELKPDGSRVEEPAAGMTLERRTRWDKGRLVTEIKAKDGGGEVKQVYSREGDRLIIEATFEGEVAAKTEKLRFVYDRRE
jgi:hypothetical protein